MVVDSVASSTRGREAPGPKLLPIVGLLLDLRRDPLYFLVTARRRYGSLVKLGQVGPRAFYFVESPEGLRHVLVDNASNYVRGPEFQVLEPVMGKSVLMLEGERWLRQRRIMAPAFNHQRVAGLVPIMTRVLSETLERWRSEAGQRGGMINISEEMIRLTLGLVARTMFSEDIQDKLGALVPAWVAANQWITDHIWMPIRPPLRWPTPSNLALRRAMGLIRRTLTEIIRKRRTSSKDHGDLLSTLILAQDPETGEGMGDEQLLDELINIMFAGFETTALPLAWTWYFLSKYPEADRRLEAELDAVLGGRTPTAEDLHALPYTRMVFDEALRIYPPFWGFPRMAVRDDEIEGFHIQGGSTIIVSPYVTQHDPEYWENPEAFDPERFTPEQIARRPRYAYFPFSAGPRFCMGQNLALVEAQVTIAMIAQEYRLELGPEPIGIKVGNALRPSRDIYMKLRPRARKTT